MRFNIFKPKQVQFADFDNYIKFDVSERVFTRLTGNNYDSVLTIKGISIQFKKGDIKNAGWVMSKVAFYPNYSFEEIEGWLKEDSLKKLR